MPQNVVGAWVSHDVRYGSAFVGISSLVVEVQRQEARNTEDKRWWWSELLITTASEFRNCLLPACFPLLVCYGHAHRDPATQIK